MGQQVEGAHIARAQERETVATYQDVVLILLQALFSTSLPTLQQKKASLQTSQLSDAIFLPSSADTCREERTEWSAGKGKVCE